ncbi:MAG: hypothetical protein GY719_15255 [bacterium]|nr:hypothetical protein [bacterium]
MKLRIAEQVLDQHPELVLGVVVVHGIDNFAGWNWKEAAARWRGIC